MIDANNVYTVQLSIVKHSKKIISFYVKTFLAMKSMEQNIPLFY